MSNDQLTAQALALPLSQRIELAQALWDSIDGPDGPRGDDDERATIELVLARAAEMDRGEVSPLSHEEVMKAARKALGCD